MIDSNREEFEKLPDIAEIIKEGVFWNGEIYRRTAICKLTHLYYVRGAWYAFQEQQKKLDCCREENKALLSKLNIPDGYKLMPVNPTERMLDAARRRQWDDLSSPLEDMDMLKYKAMIGAAP